MSKYFVEIPIGDGLISGRSVEADYPVVEFGVLKFYDEQTDGNYLVAAFMQWNNFKPEEENNI